MYCEAAENHYLIFSKWYSYSLTITSINDMIEVSRVRYSGGKSPPLGTPGGDYSRGVIGQKRETAP
jgi:hypothetical protein